MPEHPHPTVILVAGPSTVCCKAQITQVGGPMAHTPDLCKTLWATKCGKGYWHLAQPHSGQKSGRERGDMRDVDRGNLQSLTAATNLVRCLHAFGAV